MANIDTQDWRPIAVLLAIGILPFELNGLYNKFLYETPSLYWAVELISWVVLPIGIYLYGSQRGLFNVQTTGFSTPWPKTILRLIGAVFAILVLPFLIREVNLSLTFYFHDLFPNAPNADFSYHDVLPAAGSARYATTIFLAVTAALTEEFYYRGLFRQLFSRGFLGSFLFILTSSVVFASVHWEQGLAGLCITFFFGLFVAALFCATKNLWPLILGHYLTDAYWFQ